VKKRVQSVCKLERKLKFRVMQSGIWGVKSAGRTLWEFPLALGGMFTRCREDYHHLTDPHTYLMAQRCHCSHVNDHVWFVHIRVFLVKCDLYNNIASASQERERETHTNVNTRHWTVNTLLLWLLWSRLRSRHEGSDFVWLSLWSNGNLVKQEQRYCEFFHVLPFIGLLFGLWINHPHPLCVSVASKRKYHWGWAILWVQDACKDAHSTVIQGFTWSAFKEGFCLLCLIVIAS
jgi:hypothetical protein